MDILSIQPTTRTLDLLHPGTGEPIGLKLYFQSLNSEPVKQVERQLRNKALRAGRNSVTAEKIAEGEREILAAALTGWEWPEGISLGDLKNPPFNRTNAIKLFTGAQWIVEQLDTELKDESSFFTSSETGLKK